MDESRKAFEQAYEQLRKDGQTINLWDVWSMAWAASRAAIEIELPEAELVYSTATDTYGEDGCLMLPVETIARVIRAAGIKVKE